MSHRDRLIAAFREAGENLAHYLADANDVEGACALRGFVETIDGNDVPDDAGMYAGNYRMGSIAATRLGLEAL